MADPSESSDEASSSIDAVPDELLEAIAAFMPAREALSVLPQARSKVGDKMAHI